MVVYIKENLIVNSDNVCYAKIVPNEEKDGFTNKMQISLVGGESIEVDFTSVEICKKCFEHIASAIHGCPVHLFDKNESANETKLFYRGVHFVE